MNHPRRRGVNTAALLLVLAVGALIAAALYEPTTPGVPLAAPTTTSAKQEAAPPPVDTCAEPIAKLSPRARLAQLLMVGVNPTGPADALGAVQAEQIGGVFIGGDNPGLLTNNALAQVHAAAAVPLTVAVDDEGGRVQRIEMLAGDIPSARDMAEAMSPDAVRELARKRGAALKAMGVTMDLAPVVDTSAQPDRTVIGDRSFSADPAKARQYALAFGAGLRDAGVTPVLKHFPGHGNASGDSHLGSVTTPPLESLRGKDLLPYQNIGEYGQVWVMAGHLIVPGLTGGLPATLSPATYALLRNDFGFTGPTMTDDLGAMKAVTDRVPLPDAVVQALAAGVDVALWSSGGHVREVLDRVERAAATGELPPQRVDEALRRVLAAKGVC